MHNIWIDSNVVLRYLIHDDEKLFAEARRVMEMAVHSNIKLHLSTVTVAELVWVLDSFYEYPKEQISMILSDFINAQGIEIEERDIVLKALDDFAVLNVDFIDAYLAAKSIDSGWAVCSFDKTHFRRLKAERFEPK